MKLRRAGDLAILVELEPLPGFDELHGAAAALRTMEGVRACIVGHASLYLIFSDPASVESQIENIADVLQSAPPGTSRDSRHHRIRVSIHPEAAPDLHRLLTAAAIDRTRFVQTLGELRLRARYLGFRAGFAYLEGIPPEWNLPRLAQPRARVPAGTFAVAGPMAGFYPSDSPGGWNLLGRSPVVFWNPNAHPPNLINAGDSIEVEPTEELLEFPAALTVETAAGGELLAEVLRPGQLTLIVGGADEGRYVYGLPPGGPFDRPAAIAANRAAGNEDDAALLECALVGPQLMFAVDSFASWYGAPAELQLNEREVKDLRGFQIARGEILTIGRLRAGMRGYLALSGGLANPVAKYALTPLSLKPGMDLFRASNPSGPGPTVPLRRADFHVIEAFAGPHEVPPEHRSMLINQLWEVTPALDRTGIRFRPVAHVVEQPGDLPSCGMQFGTVQWHPSGELVAVGPDHPITGGYLQAMTVRSDERWKLAQLQPGDRIRWSLSPSRPLALSPSR